MNTPPRSTGVQAPDGYKTNTEQMGSAGRTISTKAEDAKGEVDQVKPAKVQAAEFGQLAAHQEFQPDYAAAIEALGTASLAMCDNLVAFAGQLGGAGTTYADSDAGAQTNVTSVQV